MRGFLESVVLPHVYLVGILVMIAEICFGVLTLTGTMSRFVNTVAFYQNLIYFLSAYWADTEEYGINLLMMILDLYIVFNGVAGPSVDSLIGKKWEKINDWKIWFFIGSIFYLAVVIYLYIT
jgi:thiosulfate dehydrogenase [quinone] large subunit